MADTTTSPPAKSRWFYPEELKDDLLNLEIPDALKAETLNCSWEYVRCVIPHWTNWDRYIAYTRIVIMQCICEFQGDLFRPEETDTMVGYKLQDLVDILFAGTPIHGQMSREIHAYFVPASEKSSSNKDGSELFRRYVNALAHSPKDYFRLRDCDASARFTIAAAWACNDVDLSKNWFNEDQWQILAELALGLYDSVAFFKHRAEGEVCNFFAYVGGDIRIETTRLYREAMWALDTALQGKQENVYVISFMRPFGGPCHIMMRRYRFVEEGLTLGRPENAEVVSQTGKNVNLWFRVEPNAKMPEKERYNSVMARKDDLMYEGLAECLERSNTVQCSDCVQKSTYGADDLYQFGGVKLCVGCQQKWKQWVTSFPARMAEAFPEVKSLPNYWV
ncbi:hypothetical protein H072_8759 [Dactylellina haptotyla CBS 200.50]|uniref:ABA 3 protein n=1 Tax=Dactylellina haptotyla (strain CBS 200.50) TaxID=1284197 RepID=S8BQM8_DACHA|nr:hypothetical protein H072_8759 [Dactylellina haptotyla CBS 200.50]